MLHGVPQQPLLSFYCTFTVSPCSISYMASCPISSDIGQLYKQASWSHRLFGVIGSVYDIQYNKFLIEWVAIQYYRTLDLSCLYLARPTDLPTYVQHRLVQYPVILDGYPSNKIYGPASCYAKPRFFLIPQHRLVQYHWILDGYQSNKIYGPAKPRFFLIPQATAPGQR